MSADTSLEWRKAHIDEYREYQRRYAKEYRRKRKEGYKPKPRGPNKAQDKTVLTVAEMSWNPRICEHGEGYDTPKAVEYE